MDKVTGRGGFSPSCALPKLQSALDVARVLSSSQYSLIVIGCVESIGCFLAIADKTNTDRGTPASADILIGAHLDSSD